jgi:hypothetical protein
VAFQRSRGGIYKRVRMPGNMVPVIPGPRPGGAASDPSAYLDVEMYHAEVDGVSAPYLAGDPGGPPNAIPAVQVHPVWEFPPSNAFQFYQNITSTQSIGLTLPPPLTTTAQLPAVAGATLLLPELVYVPPANMFTVLRLASIFIDNPTAAENVTYIIRINQAPVSGFTFRFFPRIAANESTDFEFVLRDIPQGATVDMLIQNNANTGPWTVGGALSGWSYLKSDEIALYGNVRV